LGAPESRAFFDNQPISQDSGRNRKADYLLRDRIPSQPESQSPNVNMTLKSGEKVRGVLPKLLISPSDYLKLLAAEVVQLSFLAGNFS
jgi:hypothetical protein